MYPAINFQKIVLLLVTRDHLITKKDDHLNKTGTSYFEKEYHHVGGSGGYGGRENQDNSIAIGNGNDFKNKWLGLKFVVYDINTKIDNTDGNLYKLDARFGLTKMLKIL